MLRITHTPSLISVGVQGPKLRSEQELAKTPLKISSGTAAHLSGTTGGTRQPWWMLRARSSPPILRSLKWP